MLTTYGYTLMAGSLFDPVLKHTRFLLLNAFGVALALAMQGYALYLSPKGEKDDG